MILEPEAQEELLEAAAWYDAQREGLGDDLLASVDELLGRIDEAPLSFPSDRLDARARRAGLGRFPYAIVFLVMTARCVSWPSPMRSAPLSTGELAPKDEVAVNGPPPLRPT